MILLEFLTHWMVIWSSRFRVNKPLAFLEEGIIRSPPVIGCALRRMNSVIDSLESQMISICPFVMLQRPMISAPGGTFTSDSGSVAGWGAVTTDNSPESMAGQVILIGNSAPFGNARRMLCLVQSRKRTSWSGLNSISRISVDSVSSFGTFRFSDSIATQRPRYDSSSEERRLDHQTDPQMAVIIAAKTIKNVLVRQCCGCCWEGSVFESGLSNGTFGSRTPDVILHPQVAQLCQF